MSRAKLPMLPVLLALQTGVLACAGRPPMEGPAPHPETIAGATTADKRPEAGMPVADAAPLAGGSAVQRIDRLQLRVDPPTIRVGQTARLIVEAYDAEGEAVEDVEARVYVAGPAADLRGESVIGRLPGSARVIMQVEVPAFDGRPAHTLEAEAIVEIAPAPVTRLELSPLPAGLYAGARYRATAEAYSESGLREDAQLRWTSSDESVLNVSDLGTVLAVAPGMARLGVSAEGVSAAVEVRVIANPIRRVRIEPYQLSLRTGDVAHLSALALDADGQGVPGAPIEWSVAALTGSGDVAATIDEQGTFVADDPGLYRITAVTGSVSGVAEVRAAPRPPRRTVRLLAHGVVPPDAGATTDLWVFEGTDGRDYAYTGTMQAATMYAWDVTDPAHPVITDSVKVDGRRANDVKINADATLAIITSEGASDRRNGFTILDIVDPAHPRAITHFTDGLTGGVHNVWIEGDLVYAAHNGTDAVHIVDISDPLHPRNVGRWQLESRDRLLHDITVQDGLAYLSYWDDGLVILDVGAGIRGGTPTEPRFVSQYKYRTKLGAEVYGNTHHAIRYKNYVFLGDEIGGCSECISGYRGYVHVVDVTDIEHPREVARYEVPEAGSHNLWAEDDRLYVAYYQAGLRVVDISGELRGDLYRQGREIGWYMTEDTRGFMPNRTDAWGPQPYKGHIFVSDYSSGLWILELEWPHPERVR